MQQQAFTTPNGGMTVHKPKNQEEGMLSRLFYFEHTPIKTVSMSEPRAFADHYAANQIDFLADGENFSWSTTVDMFKVKGQRSKVKGVSE